MSKEQFADLEKIKTNILIGKIRDGLDEFEKNEGQQWTTLRLEKTLLHKMLAIIVQAERVREMVQQNKRYRETLKKIAWSQFNAEPKRVVVKHQAIARKRLESELNE